MSKQHRLTLRQQFVMVLHDVVPFYKARLIAFAERMKERT